MFASYDAGKTYALRCNPIWTCRLDRKTAYEHVARLPNVAPLVLGKAAETTRSRRRAWMMVVFVVPGIQGYGVLKVCFECIRRPDAPRWRALRMVRQRLPCLNTFYSWLRRGNRTCDGRHRWRSATREGMGRRRR